MKEIIIVIIKNVKEILKDKEEILSLEDLEMAVLYDENGKIYAAYNNKRTFVLDDKDYYRIISDREYITDITITTSKKENSQTLQIKIDYKKEEIY